MAFTKPVTYSNLKSLIQAEVEQNTDSPDADDVSYWLVIINRLIGDWEEVTEWKELWTYETSGGTITANDTSYPMGASVRRLSENVELHYTDGQIEYVPILDLRYKQRYASTGQRFAFVSGTPGSYILNLGWTPQSNDSAIGATVKYPFYKYATKLSDDADVIEMSDPNWLVDSTVSEVSNQPYKSQKFASRAMSKMRQMRLNNEEEEDQTVPDDEEGFGL